MPDATQTPQPAPAIPDHELIRPVGRGSYGEVWLARNVLGEFRAVKLVRQNGQADNRPFQREFEGLQKFEPISRSHEGLVQILHVGRFDGGFYYIMELADQGTESPKSEVRSPNQARNPKSESAAAGRAEAAATSGLRGSDFELPSDFEIRTSNFYSPRTLRREIQERGRLPVGECLDIALQLSDALAHLHSHGLVHRDIKPSNIIFVRGRPKLADIGLVAAADASLTCVGTEGYLPPEGPGKPPADLYALGKVLYELATGRDRTDFPELPTRLREAPERGGLEELNEVILRACDPDTRRRYQTAAAMRADLTLLEAGKSLQQRRRHERAWLCARKLTLATVAGVAFTAVVRWFTPESPQGAPLAARPLAVEHVWDRFDVSPDGERIAFTPPSGVLVWERHSSTTRRIEIHGAEGWLTPGVSGAVGIPRWAPDSRHLAFMPVKQIGGTPDGPINAYAAFLVDVHTGEARKLGSDLTESERPQDWCWQRNGQGLTCVSRERQFSTLWLSGERMPWRETELPALYPVQLGGYSSDGRWLAASTAPLKADRRERDVWLVPHGGGRAVRLTDTPGFDADPTWGSDGETIYFVSDGGNPLSSTRGIWKLRVDLETGAPRGPAREVLVWNGQELGGPKYVAGGKKLVYGVAEPTTRIVVADAGDLSRTNSVARGRDPVLSPDGATVYFTGETPELEGVFAIDRQGRTLPQRLGDVLPLVGNFPRSFLQVSPDGGLIALPGLRDGKPGLFMLPTSNDPARLIEINPERQAISPVWSPDGQWVAYAMGRELWRVSRDLKTREVLATLYAWDGWNVRWSPDGKHIAALGCGGPHHWHARDETNHVFVVSLADRRVVQLTPESEDKYKEGLEWHPDGRRLTYFYYGPERFSAKLRWAFLDRPGHTAEMLDQEGHWDYVGVWSPEGHHFHFTSSPDHADHSNIHVFEEATGKVTHGLRAGSRPEWSRDGRTMVWAVSERKRHFEEIEFLR